MILTFNAIGLLRQQLEMGVRAHGVITKGGIRPNIIPDHTEAEFGIRATRIADVNKLKLKFDKIFKGAAEATGCRVEVIWSDTPYADLVQNVTLAKIYQQNIEKLGVKLDLEERLFYASTDFGDVSHEVASLHPMFNIFPPSVTAPPGNHTREFTAHAATSYAHDKSWIVAKALAYTGVDLLLREELVKECDKSFKEGEKVWSKL